jgi:hypothetical protein
LVVIVLEHGAQREIVHAATFQAPKAQPPTKVSGLRVSRHGSTVSVTWNGKGTRATAYDVRLTTSAGLKLQQRTTKPQATFQHVDRDFGGAVSVRGISAAEIVGDSKQATLHGGPELTLRSAKLDVTKKHDVAVPVTCSGGTCRSVLQLVVKGAHGPVRAALGTVRLAAGHKSIVTLHLTSTGAKLLAAHKAVTATVSVSTADSSTVTRTVQLLRQ